MQEAIKNSCIPEEAYLEMERASEIKHEYYQGEIFAMAGATYEHNTIISNVVRELGIQLRGKPCRAISNDMKIRMGKSSKYSYPDVVIICGKAEFFDNRRDVLTNPIAIIEVLSDSTESYDRGDKFAEYRTLESLKEYVLVSQNKQMIEKYAKNESGFWVLSYTDENRREITLESIDCKLNLDDVYEKVFQ